MYSVGEARGVSSFILFEQSLFVFKFFVLFYLAFLFFFFGCVFLAKTDFRVLCSSFVFSVFKVV